MSDNEELESGIIYYELESSVAHENKSVLQDVGEYVLPPQDGVNNPTSNYSDYRLQTSEIPRPSHRNVVQDEYDEDHYSIARPSTCQTERYGVLQNATSENKPTRKEGMFNKQNMKIAALVFIPFITIGVVVTLAIVLTDQKGITNIFYFI